MRIDPIGERYYEPLRKAERCADWIFWALALLSIGAVVVDRRDYARTSDFIQIVFVVGVILNFLLAMLIRLHWTPRAEGKRREELLSNAFSVNLTHERTQDYYNNDVSASVKRLAVVLLENSFFSKEVSARMVVYERWRVGGYFFVWTIALLNRSSDLALLGLIAQVLFSENLVSRLVRIEWLHIRFERAYENLYALLQNTRKFESDTFRAKAIDLFGYYETSKAYGGVVLSSKIFSQSNKALSEEWARVRAALGL